MEKQKQSSQSQLQAGPWVWASWEALWQEKKKNPKNKTKQTKTRKRTEKNPVLEALGSVCYQGQPLGNGHHANLESPSR